MVSFSKDDGCWGGRGRPFILLPFEGGVPRYQLPFLPGGKKERGIVEKKRRERLVLFSQKKREEEKRREEK